MWMVEVNFAGHQFTHRTPDRRRPIFRFTPRGFGWRAPQMRGIRAA